jgi:hypothetical protein
MAAQQRRPTSGLADARRLTSRLGEELRTARIGAGISQATAARDLRAWDAMVDGDGAPFFVEGESRVGDAQALERRLLLKQRDDPRASTIVLVLTRGSHHRELLREHREVFRSLLPLDGPAVLRAIRNGRQPPASGIVVI